MLNLRNRATPRPKSNAGLLGRLKLRAWADIEAAGKLESKTMSDEQLRQRVTERHRLQHQPEPAPQDLMQPALRVSLATPGMPLQFALFDVRSDDGLCVRDLTARQVDALAQKRGMRIVPVR